MNEPKPGIATTEFWAVIVNTIIGLLTMIGIVNPASKDALVQSLNTLVGAAITISGVIAYLISRTWLKAKTPAEIKNA